MGDEVGDFENRGLEIFEKVGPQFLLLLFPSLCAFVIIFSGESLIVSDLAFIFGAILLLETIYFTFWGFNDEQESETNDNVNDLPGNISEVETRLECPECKKRFYVIFTEKVTEIECKHCAFTGIIEDSWSILED